MYNPTYSIRKINYQTGIISGGFVNSLSIADYKELTFKNKEHDHIVRQCLTGTSSLNLVKTLEAIYSKTIFSYGLYRKIGKDLASYTVYTSPSGKLFLQSLLNLIVADVYFDISIYRNILTNFTDKAKVELDLYVDNKTPYYVLPEPYIEVQKILLHYNWKGLGTVLELLSYIPYNTVASIW